MFDRNWEFDECDFYLLIATTFAVGFLVFCCGVSYGRKMIEKEAIKSGVAHYVADEQGNSKFEYNKNAN